MDKKTKRRVRGVAVFVVFLALATSLLIFSRKEGKSGVPDFKASTLKYQNLKMINKAFVQFNTENLTDTKVFIEKLINANASKSIEQADQPGYGSYIFITPNDKLPSIISELSTKGKIVSKTTTTDTSLVYLDYDAESSRLKSYEKEMSDLDQIRFPSELQIRRKETLHRLISDGSVRLEKLRDVDNTLLYITASPVVKRGNFASTIRDFSLSFLMWLGIYFVGVVLVYYGTKLLMWLLNLIGVKGLGVSGGDYSSQYYSNYKNYSSRSGYGYGNRRKTKRIYKEKAKPSEEDKK